MAAEPVGTEAEALRRLCWEKCHGMELGNHLTGFNALQNIGEPHVEMLKRMGYSYTSPRLHDFGWTCRFDGNNGALMDISSVFWGLGLLSGLVTVTVPL